MSGWSASSSSRLLLPLNITGCCCCCGSSDLATTTMDEDRLLPPPVILAWQNVFVCVCVTIGRQSAARRIRICIRPVFFLSTSSLLDAEKLFSNFLLLLLISRKQSFEWVNCSVLFCSVGWLAGLLISEKRSTGHTQQYE